MAAMALWHSAGISSSSGGSGICRISLACVHVCVGVLGLDVIGVSVFDLGSMLLAAFLSLVMRFSCLVSDFVIGGCSFVVVSCEGGGGPLVRSFGLVGGRYQWFPPSSLPLCLFGRW